MARKICADASSAQSPKAICRKDPMRLIWRAISPRFCKVWRCRRPVGPVASNCARSRTWRCEHGRRPRMRRQTGRREMRANLKASAFPDGIGERTIDDVSCVELLLDQARPKIKIDCLLLVGHNTVIDRRDTNLGAAQPVERNGGRDAHQFPPSLGVSADVGQRPGARSREPAKKIFQL